MEDKIMGNKLLIAWLISLPILIIYLVFFDFNLYKVNHVLNFIVTWVLLLLPIYGCIRFIESYIIIKVHQQMQEEIKKNEKENNNENNGCSEK